MIYLDNAATTRVFDCAADAAAESMRTSFFNPNATYAYAIGAKKAMETARKNIAARLGAGPDELFFTACATESNNWVLNNARKKQKGNVVISAGEHSSIYEPAMQLKNRGTDVRIVPLDRSGAVDVSAFERAVDADTTLVSVIHVSNETGVVNPIKRLADIVKKNAPAALFHSDGVQGAFKTETALHAWGVDLYSVSAHKLGAPKGIGLLYVRNGVNLSPLLFGGGQEFGMRSGTQNTPGIAAFSAAVERFCAADKSFIKPLRKELAEYFTANGCDIIGGDDNSGYIMCVHIGGVKAEILQSAVCDSGVVIGKGAACSGSRRGNRVLSAMGLSDRQAECCVRISFSVDTVREEALRAAEIIVQTANRIRSENV